MVECLNDASVCATSEPSIFDFFRFAISFISFSLIQDTATLLRLNPINHDHKSTLKHVVLRQYPRGLGARPHCHSCRKW
jgi:hypothetical protein